MEICVLQLFFNNEKICNYHFIIQLLMLFHFIYCCCFNVHDGVVFFTLFSSRVFDKRPDVPFCRWFYNNPYFSFSMILLKEVTLNFTRIQFDLFATMFLCYRCCYYFHLLLFYRFLFF